MKLNERNEVLKQGGGTAFSKACLKSCEKILAQIRNVRETILAEARETSHVHERLLRSAVNEAEGLAWQTLYPQLVFPDLAMEKIRRVAHWSRRQQLAV